MPESSEERWEERWDVKIGAGGNAKERPFERGKESEGRVESVWFA